MKVLLVEDNQVTSDALACLLESEGHQVTKATHGREGLAVLEREVMDLIYLDQVLPGIGGLEVLRTIHLAGITTPVVFATALSDEELCRVIQENGLLGQVTILQKPFDISVFLFMVRSLAARLSSGGES